MTHTIFFDLDGTLTDPRTGIVRSIQYALNRLGLEPRSDEDLLWCIGPPLLDSFGTLVGEDLAPAALEHYRERFADVGWLENEPYAGIADALDELSSNGANLFVATSKPFVFAEKIVAYFKLDRYFSRVFGSELDGTRSNKGDLLRYALSEVGVSSQSVMVGDREHDILGAKENGMRAIGVTYGYGSHEELTRAGADSIADSVRELPAKFI